MRKTYGQKYYYNIVSNWQSWASCLWSRIYYVTILFFIIKVPMSLLRMFIFNKLGIRFSSHYHVKCHKIKDRKKQNAMTKTNPLSKWQNAQQLAKWQENPRVNNVCWYSASFSPFQTLSDVEALEVWKLHFLVLGRFRFWFYQWEEIAYNVECGKGEAVFWPQLWAGSGSQQTTCMDFPKTSR